MSCSVLLAIRPCLIGGMAMRAMCTPRTPPVRSTRNARILKWINVSHAFRQKNPQRKSCLSPPAFDQRLGGSTIDMAAA
jgi:hypothetical protein